MTLSGLHLLWTYQGTFECDHCLAWGSLWQTGTMTLEKLASRNPKRPWEEFNGCPHEDAYADACHFCYEARRALRTRFPEILTPDQMYGVIEEKEETRGGDRGANDDTHTSKDLLDL